MQPIQPQQPQQPELEFTPLKVGFGYNVQPGYIGNRPPARPNYYNPYYPYNDVSNSKLAYKLLENILRILVAS